MINKYKSFNKQSRTKMAVMDQNRGIEATYWSGIRSYNEGKNAMCEQLMNALVFDINAQRIEQLVSKAYHEYCAEHIMDAVNPTLESFLVQFRKYLVLQMAKDLGMNMNTL